MHTFIMAEETPFLLVLLQTSSLRINILSDRVERCIMVFVGRAVLHTDSGQDMYSCVTYFTNFTPYVFLSIWHVKRIFGATSKCKSGYCIIRLHECFCWQRFKYSVTLFIGLGNEFPTLRRNVVLSSSGLIFQILLFAEECGERTFNRSVWRWRVQEIAIEDAVVADAWCKHSIF